MNGSIDYTVIRGGLLLDIRAHSAAPADLLIAGDTIAEIGRPGLAAPEGARTINATDRLLMPGLINSHTHGHGNLVKGIGDLWTLELLLNAGPYLNGHRTVEDKYLTCLLGGLEMIGSGTTSCYDLFYEFPMPSLDGLEAAARGYREAGVRTMLAPMVADHSFYEAIPGLMETLPPTLRKEVERFRLAPAAETLGALKRIIAGWHFDPDEARLALAPTIPLHCSDAFILSCRDLAREAALGLHMHLAESKVQAVSGLRRYGKTLTAHLDTLGFLGPAFTAAHAVWLDDDDIARLADRGASVAHNPGSNLRLGSGVAPARRMRERGVNVGIGTDGPHCSDNQNMFEAMRLASFASRICSADWQRWLSTEEVLTMATEGSARALGLAERVGKLAKNFKADIVFLDLGHFNFMPFTDPTNQIVHTENGAAVDSVMVGGRLVLDRGRFTTVDVDKLRAKVAARTADLRQKNLDVKGLTVRIEDAIANFCVGLARNSFRVQRYIPDCAPSVSA
jgi:guanine deaminase